MQHQIRALFVNIPELFWRRTVSWWKAMMASATHTSRHEGELRMSSRFVAKKISPDKSESIRVEDKVVQRSSADGTPDGVLAYEIIGRSRQNEEGVVDVCDILAQGLRLKGTAVGSPRRASGPEGGVDCEIPCGDSLLHVQITRPATPIEWRTLAQQGKVARPLDTGVAIADLLEAIGAKASRTAPVDRSHVVLAIDATETVVHAMSGVVQAFRQKHSADIRRLGFLAVWVVGPEGESVHRLDVEK